MRREQPDLSQHEVTPGLLSGIFPQLKPLTRFMGNSKVAKTRTAAFVDILKQLFLAAIVCTIIILCFSATRYLIKLIGISQISEFCIELSTPLFGLPLMLYTLLVMNNLFDLFYLLVTGQQFHIAGKDLQLVKVLILVVGFCGGMLVGITLWVHGGAYLNERLTLYEQQKEYFNYLDQGRDAWNTYITAGPQHRVDFSYTDLSNRNFNGFFFRRVHFNHANLTGTVFEDCDLSGAYFNNATCRKTNFKNSYLRSAEFAKADVKGVNFEGAYGEKENFKKVKIDQRELDKLRPPADSRWHDSTWMDYHSKEWLRKNNYYSGP